MRMRVTRFVALVGCLWLAAALPARALDADVRQLIVSVAPDWNSSQGRLWFFQREAGGEWRPSGAPIPVLYGKNGLAWGRGMLGTGEPGLQKKERDGRAPTGVFKIGKIYTYDAALPGGAVYPFRQVTLADAWVDDPKLPNYNQHVVIDNPKNPPPWFDKMKMRHGDFAYRWLVEIRHNSDPPAPNAGSAIFFHIRRGETRPTSGCTTMAEGNLVRLIRWLRADANPAYALLPQSEYDKKWREWGLPDPALLQAKP
jgi:L,D-peptidoglycan transpeptidase YkuD (ErfK/YbiS/YcfS/YnhG family)